MLIDVSYNECEIDDALYGTLYYEQLIKEIVCDSYCSEVKDEFMGLARYLFGINVNVFSVKFIAMLHVCIICMF